MKTQKKKPRSPRKSLASMSDDVMHIAGAVNDHVTQISDLTMRIGVAEAGQKKLSAEFGNHKNHEIRLERLEKLQQAVHPTPTFRYYFDKIYNLFNGGPLEILLQAVGVLAIIAAVIAIAVTAISFAGRRDPKLPDLIKDRPCIEVYVITGDYRVADICKLQDVRTPGAK